MIMESSPMIMDDDDDDSDDCDDITNGNIEDDNDNDNYKYNDMGHDNGNTDHYADGTIAERT